MKKRSITNWTILFLLIGVGLYFNWDDFYDPYGKTYNKQRDKLGILEIPNDWVANGKGKKTKVWMPKEFREVKKGRLGKEVLVDKDNGYIYIERDRIINRTTNKYEGVEVSYRFNESPKFKYIFFEIENNTHTNQRELTKSEFLAIMTDWGI